MYSHLEVEKRMLGFIQYIQNIQQVQRHYKVSWYSEYFICKETRLTGLNQFYINTLQGVLVQ